MYQMPHFGIGSIFQYAYAGFHHHFFILLFQFAYCAQIIFVSHQHVTQHAFGLEKCCCKLNFCRGFSPPHRQSGECWHHIEKLHRRNKHCDHHQFFRQTDQVIVCSTEKEQQPNQHKRGHAKIVPNIKEPFN